MASTPPVEGWLDVGDHQLYYSVAGPSDGIPVFIFHGGWGPRDTDGACCQGDRWRVVTLHQRGWGKSKPPGEIKDNTPACVIADAEALRVHLGIPRWIAVGGSTGAMLALLFSLEFPKSVSGVLLRGTWLLRTKDIL